ncbi:chitin synthase-domain-containing protein [Xylariaceae sp. FL1651]|nr:chitin synthase-domain-containing protein [Xylariaceae sp. FL1651]
MQSSQNSRRSMDRHSTASRQHARSDENPFDDPGVGHLEEDPLANQPQGLRYPLRTYIASSSGHDDNSSDSSSAGQALRTGPVISTDNIPQAQPSNFPYPVARSYKPPPRSPRRSAKYGTEAGPSTSNALDILPVPVSTRTGSRIRPPLTVNEKTAAEAAQEVDPHLIKMGKRMVKLQKYLLVSLVIAANFTLIFASWWWPQYYYIYLPFISFPLLLNCIMILNILVWQSKNLIFKPRRQIPKRPETIVLLMPCYNETLDECVKSLDSLVNQVGIEQHKKVILIICDGKVRGPGMDKTTAQYLHEDILVDQSERRSIRAAYIAWDGQSMDVEISRGTYKGIPFFCIIKEQNQGKRDSLIVSRSFVHSFNKRHERPRIIFRPDFFKSLSDWLVNEATINRVDFIIGMDADTVFSPDCIGYLIKEAQYPDTVGVCGFVAVDFSSGNWNLWAIYQSAEYTIAQALRRLHQSVVTHKVSCLPGCCQLLRVCEETCGDEILIKRFGYHPKPTDGIIRRIRGTASEDRNHVCLMLMDSSRVRTRQALRARAYTDVPRTLGVFLSQRRRWTLGATSNDLMLFLHAPLFRFNIWERIVALSNVLTWCLNPFAIASLACMIYAFIHQPLWIVMIFASIMMIPLLFYISMVVWMPHNALERAQFLLGLTIFTIVGPFINFGVTLYACYYMDNFGWGKTRRVISETGEAEEPDAEAQQDRLEAVALGGSEKIAGSPLGQVPDLENQYSSPSIRTPFRALDR